MNNNESEKLAPEGLDALLTPEDHARMERITQMYTTPTAAERPSSTTPEPRLPAGEARKHGAPKWVLNPPPPTPKQSWKQQLSTWWATREAYLEAKYGQPDRYLAQLMGKIRITKKRPRPSRRQLLTQAALLFGGAFALFCFAVFMFTVLAMIIASNFTN